MQETIAYQIGQMFGKALTLSLVHAVFLRAAARWVVNVKVPFGTAYGLNVLIAIVGGFVALGLGMGIGLLNLEAGAATVMAVVAAILFQFGLAGVVYGNGIKDEAGETIGIWKGLRTALAQVGLAVLVLGVVAVVVFGIVMLIEWRAR